MGFLSKFIEFLQNGELWQIALLIFAINLAQVIFVVLVGNLIVKYFSFNRISDLPTPTTKLEYVLVTITILLNSFITIAGLFLWREGWIVISNGSILSMALDMVVFVLFVDLSMYILHRVAHWEAIFPFLHKTHHVHVNPKPISLFVLHPFETISFGFLWLLILILYPASWPGVFLFMTFNLLFGMMGHLGVEPFGKSIFRKFYIQLFATSTFHALHHKTDKYNFGFYLVLWDRLLKTIEPSYFDHFKNRK